MTHSRCPEYPECARIQYKIRQWGRSPELPERTRNQDIQDALDASRYARNQGALGLISYGTDAAEQLGFITSAARVVAASRRRCAMCRCFFRKHANSEPYDG